MNKHSAYKNPNWQEADQLAVKQIYSGLALFVLLLTMIFVNTVVKMFWTHKVQLLLIRFYKIKH